MKYETGQDQDREKKVAEYVAKKWHGEVFKGDEYAPLDFTFVRGGLVVAMLEVKVRKTLYDTIWFPLSKALHAHIYQQFGIPTYFFVAQSGSKPIWIDIAAQLPEKIEWNGRADREKQEPLLCFRRQDFCEL